MVNNAAGNSQQTLAKLYEVIRNVALPPRSADATGNELTEQRLVMLLPGKVLSYYDYFPGDAYEAYLENPDYGYTDQQVIIPPRVYGEYVFADGHNSWSLSTTRSRVGREYGYHL